jgi:hypothetical protein
MDVSTNGLEVATVSLRILLVLARAGSHCLEDALEDITLPTMVSMSFSISFCLRTWDMVFAQNPCSLDIFLHLFSKIIIKDGQLDFFAKREGDEGGDGDDGNLGHCLLPINLFDHVGLEGNLWTEFFCDIIKLLNGEAGSYFIAMDFNNGRGATFVVQIANDAK